MNPERWEQVKQLYDAARARPSAARAAFLAEACAGDEALRHQVEVLLDQPIDTADLVPFVHDPAPATPLIGRRLGVYHVQALIGRGGMGEVYRARDTRLERDVAVKVLPAAIIAGPERLARFEREARIVAALNHPHIAAIYGVEERDGVQGLVLELVEGDTLSERLSRVSRAASPGLPVGDALEYARQIARALEAAHAKGIIHRDLKPGNIKITPDGAIKLLDFGIAKMITGDSPTQALTETSPAADATHAGAIVGTAAYMSPQQARGEAVDNRADIWAFGCVVYEMLTGRSPFARATLHETLAAVCDEEPDWNVVARSTPASIRYVLRSCLEKDPARRPRDIVSVRRVIDDALARRPRRPVRTAAAAGVAAIILTAAAVALFRERRPPGPDQWVQLTRFADSAGQPALSPDGRMVAFVRGVSTFITPGQIFVKPLPEGEAVQVTNDELTKMSPAFSPDGSRIAYSVFEGARWNTWQVAVINGQARPWLENASGLTWTGKDRLLFSERKNNNIHMAIVSARSDKSESRDVYVPAKASGMAHRSYLSPDGKWVLIVEMDNGPWVPCRLVSVDGRSPDRQVGPLNGGCTFAAWSPDGKWIYLSSSAGGAFHIWRQRFPGGEPQQITSGPTEEEGIAVAPDGRSFVTAVASKQSAVWVHRPDGDRQVSLEGFAFDPVFTLDGRSLLYRILSGPSLLDPSELFVTDLESRRTEPLLPGVSISGAPSSTYDVSLDGHRAVVLGGSGEQRQLWIVTLDRRSPPRAVPNVDGFLSSPFFLRSGEIVFRMGPERILHAVQEDGTGLRRLFDRPALAIRGLSPDGRWLVVLEITKDEESGFEGRSLVARSLTGAADLRLISPVAPPSLTESVVKWSADGRILSVVPAAQHRGQMMTKAYSFPITAGGMSAIPPGGFRSEAELGQVPGATSLDIYDYAPGPSEGLYAFTRESVQRNLYRIPLR
jgi:Tol biopolymer transport system component